MRLSLVVVALGGCFGDACQKANEEKARMLIEMAPVIAEYVAIDPARLARAELSLVRGRKVLVLEDARLSSTHEGPWVPEGLARLRAEVGIVIIERSGRDPEPLFAYEGGETAFGGWVTHDAIAHPEKRLVFTRRSWCPPPTYSIGVSKEPRGPRCGFREKLVESIREGREPSLQMHRSTEHAEVRKLISETAREPEEYERWVLEAYIDFESKTDNIDVAAVARMKAALEAVK